MDVNGRAMDARWSGEVAPCQATSRNRRIASRMISLVVACSASAITARSCYKGRHQVGGPPPSHRQLPGQSQPARLARLARLAGLSTERDRLRQNGGRSHGGPTASRTRRSFFITSEGAPLLSD